MAVWHVLTEGCADRYAEPVKVARKLFGYAFDVGKHLPTDERKLVWLRHHLDRLKLGQDMTHLPWGSKNFRLPESSLAPERG